MNIWKWLYRMIFLEKFTWPAGGVYAPPDNDIESKELLYQGELDALMGYLSLQLLDSVSFTFHSAAKVDIRSGNELIATITVYPKGFRRRDVFVLVELKPERVDLKVWFQLAFLGFRLRFRKSTLYPVSVRVSVPRGP